MINRQRFPLRPPVHDIILNIAQTGRASVEDIDAIIRHIHALEKLASDYPRSVYEEAV